MSTLPLYRMRRIRRSSLATLALLLLPIAAHAVTATTAPFTGNDLSVELEIDDEIDPGNLVITLTVIDPTADLRGFFAQVSDESLLPGLSVSGASVTGTQFEANAVINLGGGSNLNGGGSPCPCDFGVEIGTSGIGSDDYQQVTFTLSHDTEDLSLALLDQQSFGIRATSVGTQDGPRNGSSKLVGVVPEPSTALLIGMGLAAMSGRRRP